VLLAAHLGAWHDEDATIVVKSENNNQKNGHYEQYKDAKTKAGYLAKSKGDSGDADFARDLSLGFVEVGVFVHAHDQTRMHHAVGELTRRSKQSRIKAPATFELVQNIRSRVDMLVRKQDMFEDQVVRNQSVKDAMKRMKEEATLRDWGLLME
jgi:hypothetical protein